jgi:hypothetical protein
VGGSTYSASSASIPTIRFANFDSSRSADSGTIIQKLGSEMIEISEVVLLLRGWADDSRRFRVFFRSRSQGFVLSAFCTVLGVEADSFTLALGSSDLDRLTVSFEDLIFEFGDTPSDADKDVRLVYESALVASGSGLTLMIGLLTR